jgi:polyphenol oxidase
MARGLARGLVRGMVSGLVMLERVAHDNGLVTYRSPRLAAVGVVHGFSTRVGGVSGRPYDSLNLGSLTKGLDSDDNTNVAENFRRLRAALGVERHIRIAPRQVHGAAVWRPPSGPLRPADAPPADIVVTDQPHHLLTVRTADCVPVLLAGVDGRSVAAVHAGWRGLVAGGVTAAVAALRDELGVEASRLVAAIGPAIGVRHYEVGDDVAAAFASAGLGDAVASGQRVGAGARPHVDLAAAALRQLLDAGVPASAIDRCECCTFAGADAFFSHRRDRGRTGRMAAVIAARG